MSFDFKLLGRKIKEARESLLIEKEEVAKYLRCSIEEYEKIENGESSSVDGDTIILISQVLEMDFRYFVSGDYVSAESQIKELFRQNGDITKNDRKAIRKFIRLCEEKHNLEGLLSRQKPLPYDYSGYGFRSNNHKYQGITAAYRERKRLNIDDSINDIYGLLRKQKIHIFRRRLEDSNISGVYIKHPIAGHCVLINYSDDIYRQNFSMAHEYCHVLFDSGKEQSITYFNREMNYVEIRANNFASNFLLPAKGIESINTDTSYEELIKIILDICNHYNVSSKVVVYRLKEKRLISEKLVERLLKDERLIISKSDKIDPELAGASKNLHEKLKKIIESGISLEYIELVRNAYQQNEISYGKMLECLQMNIEDAKQLIDLWDVYMEV
ncbi:helix-turn-helix domain-containing protein [Calorimonas adulescens]|uniref:ImmA/IrrE family metallo-endopeptidase n=1 Tax=Calorimonas adulescens TaxID=2606906 RepID=A0A5D8QBI5_9THEO|nr:XRE family transcriptional regulator [Calorimonas adulescens]TZE82095.1 ImmA/IrrE family metallo-endopeptidase [Calorimonas adulescens]